MIRPALVIVFETEIWPNLYNESKRAGAALAIVNGRISDRTWPRYSRAKWLFGPVLSRANVIFAQSETDYLPIPGAWSARREIGAARES